MLVRVEVDVRKPESLVNCDVASFCQKAAVPLVMRTVDDAPTEPNPVPPFAMLSVPVRVRVPELVIGEPVNERPVVPPDAATDVTVPEVRDERQLVVPEIQIRAASMPPAKVEVAVDVAMKRSAARELVPVAVSFDPFHVRTVLLAVTPERSRPIVPAPVIVPPVIPLLVAIEVTVPALLVRQTPPTATHPPYGRLIPARVEVAVEDAYVKETAPPNDVEAALVN